jgi:hypothetical protein
MELSFTHDTTAIVDRDARCDDFYCMRFDIDQERTYTDKFCSWLSGILDIRKLYFVCCENPRGDNPHIHAMFMTNRSIKEIRNSFTYKFASELKELKKKNKKPYSLVFRKTNLMFLCKGSRAISKLKDPNYPGTKVDPVVILKSEKIDDKHVKYLHEKWWEEAINFKTRKIEKQSRLSELKEMLQYVIKKSFIKKEVGILKYFKDELSELNNYLIPEDYSEEKLIKDIVRYYIDNYKTIRYSMMSEYVDTIWLILMKANNRVENLEQSKDRIYMNLIGYRNNMISNQQLL